MDSTHPSGRPEFRRFGQLLGAASVLSFFLIALGSLVRAADAGLACPDWPLCFGEAVPVFDTKIFLEWFHRVTAATLGFVMLGAVIKLVRTPALRKELGVQIAAASVLLVVQIVLGGLTVLKLLDAKTVAAHLLNALLFFTVLLWTTYRARRLGLPDFARRPYPVSPGIKRFFAVTTILVFAQVAIGGMVSSNYAGLACPDFPTCQGQWLPAAMSFPVTLQVLHRAMAFVVLLVVMTLHVKTVRMSLPPVAKLAIRLLPALLVLQIVLGVVNVQYALPIPASVSHLANAVVIYALLLLATIAVTVEGRSFAGQPAAASAGARSALRTKDQPA